MRLPHSLTLVRNDKYLYSSITYTNPYPLLGLKRRSTQTSKSVDASSVSPATSETQTIFEQEAKVNMPLSTSWLVVGAMVGVAVGVGTNYLLERQETEAERKKLIPPQTTPAITGLSEADNKILNDFKEPDAGRLSPVSKCYYEHLKHELNTTQDKAKLLKIKYKLHDLAKKQG